MNDFHGFKARGTTVIIKSDLLYNNTIITSIKLSVTIVYLTLVVDSQFSIFDCQMLLIELGI